MAVRKPNKSELERFDATLRRMLSVLSGDIENLEHETLGDGAGQTKPKEDDGGDSYFQELSLELLEHDEHTVREVMDAIDRIKDGTFGRCQPCEKWIGRERLKAMPHARFCIDCQRESERNGS